eukprot:3444380-Pleurochrysis_carterae.AAC.5
MHALRGSCLSSPSVEVLAPRYQLEATFKARCLLREAGDPPQKLRQGLDCQNLSSPGDKMPERVVPIARSLRHPQRTPFKAAGPPGRRLPSNEWTCARTLSSGLGRTMRTERMRAREGAHEDSMSARVPEHVQMRPYRGSGRKDTKSRRGEQKGEGIMQ